MKRFIRILINRLICNIIGHPNLTLVNRFPLKGTTGRGKIWYIHYCEYCNRYYLSNNFGYCRLAKGSNDFGFKSIGGNN